MTLLPNVASGWHFPVGVDQPWAEVTATLTILFVPLSVVVAFQPDPSVRVTLKPR